MGTAALSSAAPAAETAVVAALNSDGAGVVRGGKTAFVPGALPGETIRFERAKRHRAYDEGRLLEVLEPSPQRVTPGCSAFGVCGGCTLQHLDPQAQIESKQQEVRETLQRVAGADPERWLPPLQGPVWNYRRRARLGSKFVKKKGRVLVGFRERATPYVAALASCPVLAEPVATLIAPLGELLTRMDARAAIPQVEVAVGDDAPALVLRVMETLSEADTAMLREFGRQHGLRLFLQPGGLNSVAPLDAGPATLVYELPEWQLSLEFRPTDFVQVNGAVNRALIAQVLGLLELDGESRVLDLFCGLGNFTLPIARRAASVIGIEGDAGLVERARGNAVRNGLDNAEFFAADLAAVAATSSWPTAVPLPRDITHVLLDPPRTGAREMLPAVAALRPRRVVYVSCHPGSLARDIGILVGEHGFTLRSAGVIDMFPHTNHVESVAVLDAPP